MSGDLVNGTFEALAALFVLDHCRVLYRDKMARGLSLRACVFFTAWGFWNLVYYPSLDQWFSFVGGIGVVAANALWVSMQIVYRSREVGA